jgi:hypothetical protein
MRRGYPRHTRSSTANFDESRISVLTLTASSTPDEQKSDWPPGEEERVQ